MSETRWIFYQYELVRECGFLGEEGKCCAPPTDRSGKKSASFRGIASCASSDPSFNVMSLWRAPTNAASNSIVQTAKAYSSLLVIK